MNRNYEAPRPIKPLLIVSVLMITCMLAPAFLGLGIVKLAKPLNVKLVVLFHLPLATVAVMLIAEFLVLTGC
jgi:hypothetical protein